MAASDFSNVILEAQGNPDALIAVATARLAELSRTASQVVSLALVGAKHASETGEFEDPISADVFHTISDLAGNARAFHELRAALDAMRGAAAQQDHV